LAAAGLQDSGRALVIGSKTAGAGVIRRNVSLYNLGAINLAWAHAYAPSGYAIEERGVMPHICTAMLDATVEGMVSTLRSGEGMIDVATRTRNIAPDDAAAMREFRTLCPADSGSGDLAYKLALAILDSPGLYARLMAQGAGS
jgi:carboxyl-terminal processing protease